MALFAQGPVRCKLIVDNKRLQKVKNFIYFGPGIFCKNEKFFQQKSSKISQIVRILNNNLKQLGP